MDLLPWPSAKARMRSEGFRTPGNGIGALDPLLPELMGYTFAFLDGRSLTSFEATSAGARRSLQEHPDMFKRLLLRQLENVPQLASLRNKEGKRALIAWDGGDFQPAVALVSSKTAPSPRYLRRVALTADGWYYMYGGHLSMRMCGEVWRFRVEESRGPRKTFPGGVVIGLKWELVNADGVEDAAAGTGPDGERSDNDGANNAYDYTGDDSELRNSGSDVSDVGRNASCVFEFGIGRAMDCDATGSTDHSESSEDDDEGGEENGVGGALNPAALFNLPPAAQNAQHGAWQALAAAAVQGAGGGVQGDAHAAHAVFQAALWAQQPAFADNIDVNPVALDANGNPLRPTPRCAVSWTSVRGTNDIYLFGGLGQSDDFLSDLWHFHAGARGQCRWERLRTERDPEDTGQEVGGGGPGAIPAGRWGHTMVEHRGALYMFGGTSPGQAYTGLWRLDPSVRPCRWSLLAQEGEQPPARGGHSATVVGDTLYIFGGNVTDCVFNDMWAINLCDGSPWRQIPQTPDFPLPRIGHSAVAMGNRILIYGGRNFLADRYTAGLSCFDTELQSFVRFPHTEAFTRRASQLGGMWYGLRMTGHAAVPCSRGLMFVGGLVPRGHSTMSAWLLDIVWGRRRIAKHPSRRRARALVNAGGCGQS